MRVYKRVDGKLSPEDIDDIVRRSVASNRLEGLIMTPEEIEMEKKYLAGEISREEHTAWMLQHTKAIS